MDNAARIRQSDVDKLQESGRLGKRDGRQKDKVWFITGASSGFGRELAEVLLEQGAFVAATARNIDDLKVLWGRYASNMQMHELDVTKPSQIAQAVADAVARFRRIDVLVNNAGYGVTGAIEEVGEQEYMPMFDTNLFGLINVTRALLPQFREQGAGNIVNIASIGGLIGSAGWGYYNATKFAVEGFSEALAAEMGPLGVHVTVVEPGPFRTDFLGRSGQVATQRIQDYEPTAGKAREYFQTQAGKQPGDPRRAAEAIVAAVEAPEPPRHLLLGKTALRRFRDRLAQWNGELDRWEATTNGADFPEAGEAR